MGVRRGCESIRSLREVLDAKKKQRTNLQLAKTGLADAFILVSCSCFSDIEHRKFPKWFNWINFCYGAAFQLNFDSLPFHNSRWA